MAGQQVSRVLWADAAKGLAVIAVVFVHVSTKHVLTGVWSVSQQAEMLLEAFVNGLAPVRMPLFFIISGMFATMAIRRPWATVLRSKVWFFYYLYLLWLVIQTAVYILTPDFKTVIAKTPLDFLGQATVMPSALWYLYALALYFPLAKVARSIPRITLVAALAVSVLGIMEVVPEWGNMQSVAQYFLWFVLGAYYPDLISRFASGARAWWLAVLLPVFVAAMGVLFILNAKEPTLLTIASIAGVGAAILIVAKAADAKPRTVGWAAAVGGRTLPIYVLHMPLLALWDAATKMLPFDLVPSSPAFAVAYALLLTAIVVLVALVIYRLVKPFAPALFAAPGASPRVRTQQLTARHVRVP